MRAFSCATAAYKSQVNSVAITRGYGGYWKTGRKVDGEKRIRGSLMIVVLLVAMVVLVLLCARLTTTATVLSQPV